MPHKPSLLRQGLFTLIVLAENIILTVLTLLWSRDKMTGIYGEDIDLPTGYILIFIWVLQLLVFLLNICFYGKHPASVPIKPSKEKAVLEIFGCRWILKDGYCLERGNHNNHIIIN